MYIGLVDELWHKALRNPPQAPPGWVRPPDCSGWPQAEMEGLVKSLERTWFHTYPPQLWNHWSSAQDRTTNVAEAFHSVISR